MIVRAECMSLAKPSRSNMNLVMTEDDLHSMSRSCIGKYVYRDYDYNSGAIGLVVNSEVINDKLIVSIETNTDLNGLFCGPCFLISSKTVSGFGIFEVHAQDDILPIGSITTKITKVKSIPYYKIVTYDNIQLPVHAEVKYLAIDHVGQLWSFQEEPIVDKECYSWKPATGDWKALVAIVEFAGNWKESLIRV